MENEVDAPRISLIVVLFVSILLVIMDIVEIYFSFENLKILSSKIEKNIFENCLKFQILSQIVFAGFASLAGISAFFMSLGFLVNYRYFTEKLLDTFMFYNYIIFGPYLLGACIVSLFYFKNIVYNCDRDFKDKSFNFATFITILLCLIISILITLSHSIHNNVYFLIDSIRTGPQGNKLMGKLFWKIAIGRNNANMTPGSTPDNNV